MKARLVRCSAWLVAALLRGAGGRLGPGPAAAPKRVLMLYGHDPNAPGVVAFTNELHAIVASRLAPARRVLR